MATIPLNAVFRNDFVTLLVFVDDQDTMEVVAQKVAYHVIRRRLPPQDAPMRVQYNDQVLLPDQTVSQAGIVPLSLVEVFYDVSGHNNAAVESRGYSGRSLGR
jgi:toluene monooxygenase system protein B